MFDDGDDMKADNCTARSSGKIVGRAFRISRRWCSRDMFSSFVWFMLTLWAKYPSRCVPVTVTVIPNSPCRGSQYWRIQPFLTQYKLAFGSFDNHILFPMFSIEFSGVPCGCWELLLLHHPWDLPPRTLWNMNQDLPGHNVDYTTLARTCQIFRLGCVVGRSIISASFGCHTH